MLSFELSAIDLILAVAVLVLLILYITKLSKPSTGEKLLARKEGSSEKPATEATTPEEERKRVRSTQSQTGFARCPYGFGYLRKLDKGAPIPDECLGCSRIMECRSGIE